METNKIVIYQDKSKQDQISSLVTMLSSETNNNLQTFNNQRLDLASFRQELTENCAHLYDRSLFESINASRSILKYFNERSIKLKGNVKNYESLCKIFTVSHSYDRALQKKKDIQSDLVSKIANIKSNVQNNSFILKTGINSQGLSQLFSFQNQLTECNKLLEKSKLLIREMPDNPESSFSVAESNNLAVLFDEHKTNLDLPEDNSDFSTLNQSLNTVEEKIKVNKKKKNELETKINELTELVDNCKKKFEENKQQINLYQNDLSNIEQHKRELNQLYLEQNSAEKLKSTAQEIEAKQKELMQSYFKTLDNNQEMNQNLTNQINELKIVNKRFHIIFNLDKSGSMSGLFDSVIKSVDKIIESRRTRSDKVSVIKFNNKAEIEHLYLNVNEKIKIKNSVGGGTSFVEPLKMLDEVLDETDPDLYIPIVLFLSDGKGESLDQVLNKCKDTYNKFGTKMNMMFFTIGYGVDADDNCLEEMCKVFNNGKIILKVGQEMKLLHHRVENENQLMKAFSLFQDLFNYEKNLIESKQDMLNGFMQSQHSQIKSNMDHISNMNAKVYEQMNENKNFIKEDISNQEMNKIIEKADQDINDKLKNLTNENERLENKINQITQEKNSLIPEKEEASYKLERLEEDFQSKHQNLRKMQSNLNSKATNQIEHTTSNKKEIVIKEWKRMGAQIKKENEEDFFYNYESLKRNYGKLRNFIQEISLSSNSVDNEYESVVNDLTNLQNTINNIQLISENTEINLWELVLYYYRKNNTIDTTETNDRVNLKKILNNKVDFDDAEIEGAYDFLLSKESIDVLFSELNNNSEYINDFGKSFIDEIKQEIKNLEKDKKSLDNNSDDYDSKVDEIDKKIELKNDLKFEFNDRNSYVKTILRGMKQILELVKRELKKHLISYTMANQINNAINTCFPKVELISNALTMSNHVTRVNTSIRSLALEYN